MTKEEMFNYIEEYCKQNNLCNDKNPDAKGKGYHFFRNTIKGKTLWTWYGFACKGKFRLDLGVRGANESVQDEICALGKDYECDVLRTAFHIFFARDIPFESVDENVLGNAMRKYQEFCNTLLPKIKEILQKSVCKSKFF